MGQRASFSLQKTWAELLHNWQKDSSQLFLQKAVDIFHSIGNQYSLAKAYGMQAQMNKDLNNYQKSKECCFKSLKLFSEIHDSIGIAGMLGNIGDLIAQEGNYFEAMKYHTQALEIFTKKGHKMGQANNLLCIGHLYMVQEDYDEALKSFKRALTLEQEINRQTGISHNLNNIGTVFFTRGQKDSALAYFQKALVINKQQKDFREYANGLIMLSLINTEHGHYRLAGIQLEEALEICKQYDFKEFEMYSLLHLAELYIIWGGNVTYTHDYYHKGLKYGLEALNIAQNMSLKDDLIPINSVISQTYEKLGEYDKALEYMKNFIAVKDTLFKKERTDKVLELMEKYESNLKDRDIQHLQDLNQQAAQTKSVIIWASVIIFISLVGLLLVLISKYRLRNKTNKELNNLNYTKDKLFSIISHDLQGPVASYNKLTEFLSQNYKNMPEPDIVNNIEILRKSSNNVSNLLDNLLQWSRLQNNGLKPLLSKTELNAIIDEVTNSYSEITKNKKIHIENMLDSDKFVFADKEMLKTVLRNIVGNAIKFTHPSGSISFSSKANNGTVNICIKDNGIGIKDEDIKKIFRLDIKHSTLGTANEKGTGLGLIIAKELVELNDGKISINSKYNKGTEVIISLPNYKD